MNKKTLAIISAAIFFTPFLAFATPSSINRITDHLEPLINTDYIKAVFFTATSTTNHWTFPYASTTAISVSSLTSGNCLQASTGGFLTDTGSPCSSGGGASYPFTPSTVSGTQVSATSTAINDTQGFFDNSWRLSSSTVVCAYHCQYSDIQTAIDAGYNDIFLKPETYTLSAPLLIKRNSVSIQGNGRSTVISFDAATASYAFGSNNYASTRSFVTLKNVFFNNTGASGTGTCLDITTFEFLHLDNVSCAGTNLGIIGTSTNTFYDDIANTIVNVSGVGSKAYEFTNIAQENVLRNTRAITSTDATGYYFDGVNNVTCIACDTETNALIGMYVGATASDLNLNVYLEGNQQNLVVAPGAQSINVTGFIADANDTTNGNIVNEGAFGLKVDARVQYNPVNYLVGNEFSIGTTTGSNLLTIEGPQKTFFVTSTSTSGNISTGAPVFASPKNVSTLFIGSGLFGNEDTSGYGPDDSSGNIRFNGASIAWGDLGYYPNSGSVAASYGNFRLSTNGTTINPVPNAKLGVGSFYAGGRVGFSTTSPFAKFAINLDNNSVPQGRNAFLIASSTQTSTTTLFSISNTGIASTTGLIVSNSGGNAGCATFAADGTISNTGTTCGTGTGGGGVATTSLAATAPIQVTPTSAAITYSILASSASQAGSMSAGDWQLLHTATTTFTSPLVYTASTNAVTCPTCQTTAFTYPFTPTTYAGNQVSATTTGIFANVALPAYGFIASSTFFTYASTSVITSDTASTTNLIVSGATTLASIVTGANRALIINSTGLVSTIGFPINAGNGGTGASAFAGSMLLGTNAGGTAQVPTSTPTATAYFATSTQATSSFAGGVTVGTTSQNAIANTNFMEIISNGLNTLGGLLIHTWVNVTNAFSIVNAAGTTVFNIDDTPTSPAIVVGTSTGATAQLQSVALFGAPPLNNLLFMVASSSQAATTTLFSIDINGNIVTKGPKPTLNACGTATISATSTDYRGTVTVTAGTPTSCFIQYSSVKSDTPTCFADGPTSALGGVDCGGTASTTGVLINLPAAFSGSFTYLLVQ